MCTFQLESQLCCLAAAQRVRHCSREGASGNALRAVQCRGRATGRAAAASCRRDRRLARPAASSSAFHALGDAPATLLQPPAAGAWCPFGMGGTCPRRGAAGWAGSSGGGARGRWHGPLSAHACSRLCWCTTASVMSARLRRLQHGEGWAGAVYDRSASEPAWVSRRAQQSRLSTPTAQLNMRGAHSHGNAAETLWICWRRCSAAAGARERARRRRRRHRGPTGRGLGRRPLTSCSAARCGRPAGSLRGLEAAPGVVGCRSKSCAAERGKQGIAGDGLHTLPKNKQQFGAWPSSSCVRPPCSPLR